MNNAVTEKMPSLESHFLSTRRVRPKNNRIEFRIPMNEFWIHESMAKEYCDRGYIPKPTVSAVAKMSLNLSAIDYMNGKERAFPQRLKGVVPEWVHNRLIREHEQTKAQLSALKKQFLHRGKGLKDCSDRIKDQNRTIQILSDSLKQAQEKLFWGIPSEPDVEQMPGNAKMLANSKDEEILNGEQKQLGNNQGK